MILHRPGFLNLLDNRALCPIRRGRLYDIKGTAPGILVLCVAAIYPHVAKAAPTSMLSAWKTAVLLARADRLPTDAKAVGKAFGLPMDRIKPSFSSIGVEPRNTVTAVFASQCDKWSKNRNRCASFKMALGFLAPLSNRPPSMETVSADDCVTEDQAERQLADAGASEKVQTDKNALRDPINTQWQEYISKEGWSVTIDPPKAHASGITCVNEFGFQWNHSGDRL